MMVWDEKFVHQQWKASGDFSNPSLRYKWQAAHRLVSGLEKEPELTGTPFRFVKCNGISVPIRRDWLYELNIHFSSECFNILTSVPFREIFHFEHWLVCNNIIAVKRWRNILIHMASLNIHVSRWIHWKLEENNSMPLDAMADGTTKGWYQGGR